MTKYKLFFYGNVVVEDRDEESAISKATEFINENPKDFIEIEEVKDNEDLTQ